MIQNEKKTNLEMKYKKKVKKCSSLPQNVSILTQKVANYRKKHQINALGNQFGYMATLSANPNDRPRRRAPESNDHDSCFNCKAKGHFRRNCNWNGEGNAFPNTDSNSSPGPT